jgi:thioredoxin 1
MGTREITGKDFDSFIEGNDIAIVDFWASWCAPCKVMKPVFEKASGSFSKVAFATVDVEEEGVLASRCAVPSLPYFAVFKSGQLVDSYQGAMAPAKFNEFIQKHSG